MTESNSPLAVPREPRRKAGGADSAMPTVTAHAFGKQVVLSDVIGHVRTQTDPSPSSVNPNTQGTSKPQLLGAPRPGALRQEVFGGASDGDSTGNDQNKNRKVP